MDSTRKMWLSPVLKQGLVVSSIYFNLFGQGMMCGVTSSMLSTMQAPEADFTINMDVISWFGSITASSALFLLPIASYLMNKFGRRLTYILLNIPAVVGLVMDACAYDVPTLLIGRFLGGSASGSTAVVGLMVMGEFTSPDYRGMFLMLKTSFFSLGVLFVHIISYYLHWRNVILVTIAPYVISIIIACTWCESPYWLVENKKFKEGEESFYWLRGRTRDSTREFEEVISNQQNKKAKKMFSEKLKEFFMKFRKNNFRKPLMIIILAVIMTECGGRHIFPTYAVLILRDMTSSSIDPFYCNMALDTIITVSSFFSSHLVKIFKLRKLLFTTGSVSVVMLYLTGLSLFLVSNGTLSDEYSMIPICLLGLFFIAVNLCCTLMPMNIGAEIFPIEHRAVGACVVGYALAIIASVVLKITPLLIENFKCQGTFTIFASGLLITLLGLYFLLPETKGKTLQEIEYVLTYGNRRKIRDYDDEVENDVEKTNKNLLST